jgi:hypothetical protein
MGRTILPRVDWKWALGAARKLLRIRPSGTFSIGIQLGFQTTRTSLPPDCHGEIRSASMACTSHNVSLCGGGCVSDATDGVGELPGAEDTSATSWMSAAVHAGAQVLCSQCGVVAWPHSFCRCLLCGDRHPHNPGCRPVHCFQCGLLLKPHRRCLCRRCNRVHSHGSLCQQQHRAMSPTAPAAPRDPVGMLSCEQCGQIALPHDRCRCALCSSVHDRGSPCRPHRADRLRAAMNGSVPQVQFLGDCDQVCPHCLARTWRSESMSCCAAGPIVLPNMPDVPEDFTDIMLTPHVRSHIRKHNMAVAMASVGHQNISLPDGMFTLGGKTFHRVGSMLPEGAAPHAFAQIYMLDTQEASDRRVHVMGSRNDQDALRPEVLSRLHTFIMHHNPWVRQFVAAARSNLPRLVWRSADDINTMQMGALVAQPGSRRDIVIERQVLSLACGICGITNLIPLFPGPVSTVHSRWSFFIPPSRISFAISVWHTRMA